MYKFYLLIIGFVLFAIGSTSYSNSYIYNNTDDQIVIVSYQDIGAIIPDRQIFSAKHFFSYKPMYNQIIFIRKFGYIYEGKSRSYNQAKLNWGHNFENRVLIIENDSTNDSGVKAYSLSKEEFSKKYKISIESSTSSSSSASANASMPSSISTTSESLTFLSVKSKIENQLRRMNLKYHDFFKTVKGALLQEKLMSLNITAQGRAAHLYVLPLALNNQLQEIIKEIEMEAAVYQKEGSSSSSSSSSSSLSASESIDPEYLAYEKYCNARKEMLEKLLYEEPRSPINTNKILTLIDEFTHSTLVKSEDWEKHKCELFKKAIENNDIEGIQELLTFIKIIDFLIESPLGKVTPLYLAVLYKHNEIVELLLKHGAQAESIIHDAAADASKESFEILLKYVSNINCLNSMNDTPLIIATRYGNYIIMESLLKKGANPDIQNTRGETALMRAIFNDAKKNVELLLRYNAKIDVVSNVSNKTALDIAVELRTREIVYLLGFYREKDSALSSSSAPSSFEQWKKERVDSYDLLLAKPTIVKPNFLLIFNNASKRTLSLVPIYINGINEIKRTESKTFDIQFGEKLESSELFKDLPLNHDDFIPAYEVWIKSPGGEGIVGFIFENFFCYSKEPEDEDSPVLPAEEKYTFEKLILSLNEERRSKINLIV